MQFLSDSHAIGPTTTAVAQMLEDAGAAGAAGAAGVVGEGGEVGAVGGMVNGSEGGWDSIRCGFAENSAQFDRICEFVASTSWDGVSLTVAREKRLELCGMMQLQMTMKAPGGEEKGKLLRRKKEATDEHDSYEALVREAGY